MKPTLSPTLGPGGGGGGGSGGRRRGAGGAAVAQRRLWRHGSGGWSCGTAQRRRFGRRSFGRRRAGGLRRDGCDCGARLAVLGSSDWHCDGGGGSAERGLRRIAGSTTAAVTERGRWRRRAAGGGGGSGWAMSELLFEVFGGDLIERTGGTLAAVMPSSFALARTSLFSKPSFFEIS